MKGKKKKNSCQVFNVEARDEGREGRREKRREKLLFPYKISGFEGHWVLVIYLFFLMIHINFKMPFQQINYLWQCNFASSLSLNVLI